MQPDFDIAIIGAGPAGLACAKTLQQAGLEPALFDKSRGIGGRVASRRREGLAWDHGAPSMARDHPALRALLARAQEDGVAAPWPAGTAWKEAAQYSGIPGANAPLRQWLPAENVFLGQEVLQVHRSTEGVELITSDDAVTCARAALAIPAPQALRLISPADATLRAALSRPTYKSSLSALLAFVAPTGLPPLLEAPSPHIDVAIQQNAKPGQALTAECWVVHGSAAASAAHLEDSKEEIACFLSEAFRASTGLTQTPLLAMGHRWRYSRVATDLGAACIASNDGRLVAGGDWALGPNIEHAVESGRAMAQSLLDSGI